MKSTESSDQSRERRPTSASRTAPAKPQNRPNQDTETSGAKADYSDRTVGHEPRGIDSHIADADKEARTGTTDEKVRNTPPFADFDDTVPHNESEKS
jgi:hypothetical protein